MFMNEQVKQVIEELNSITERRTGKKSVSVTVTGDMSIEEKELALTEGFLKEGYTIEEASAKAKEWLAVAELIFDKPAVM